MSGTSRWDRLRLRAEREGTRLVGLYNRNYVVELPEELSGETGLPPRTPVKVRIPIKGADMCDVRIWAEDDLLDALARASKSGSVADAPRVLARGGDYSVQTYIEGRNLTEVHPCASDLPEWRLVEIGELFRQIAAVSVGDLPKVPVDWPRGDQSQLFYHRILAAAEGQADHFRADYGTLFHDLGLVPGLWDRRRSLTAALTERPFALLHTDVHRGNVIVRDGGGLALIDWELSLAGDPVYELACHLCRMPHDPERQWNSAVRMWAEAVSAVAPARLEGLETDVEVYVALERLRSAHNDTVRAAGAVRRDPSRIDREAGVIAASLAAVEDLGVDARSPSAVADALKQWLAAGPASSLLTGAR